MHAWQRSAWNQPGEDACCLVLPADVAATGANRALAVSKHGCRTLRGRQWPSRPPASLTALLCPRQSGLAYGNSAAEKKRWGTYQRAGRSLPMAHGHNGHGTVEIRQSRDRVRRQLEAHNKTRGGLAPPPRARRQDAQGSWAGERGQGPSRPVMGDAKGRTSIHPTLPTLVHKNSPSILLRPFAPSASLRPALPVESVRVGGPLQSPLCTP